MRKHINKNLIRSIGLGLAVFSLSACDWVGFMLKEGALSITERSGWKSFAIEGQLPPDFAIEVQAHYGPVESKHCQTYSVGLGKEITRNHMESFKTQYQSTAQNYRFKVPLTYSIGLCEMQLGRVGFLIDGRYGEQDWQQHGSSGGLRIVKALPEGAPGFKADGTLDIQGECTWLFQESKMYLQLSKLLSCKGAGAFVQRDQLPGKIIKLDIRLNPEEGPSYNNRWIETPKGWKPCKGTDKSERCQSPPTFKTFQMNGQTCTVYPNCTE